MSVPNLWPPEPRGRQQRVRIALTPLIDVVFILLVFLMLASNFQHWRTIQLSAAAPSGGSGQSQSVMVGVEPNGLLFAGQPITADALTARLTELITSGSKPVVLVRPGEGVSTGRLVGVLDLLTAAGVDNVTLLQTP